MNYQEKNHLQPAGLAGGLFLCFLLGVLLFLPGSVRAQPMVMSFSNAAPITINDGYADSSPFPVKRRPLPPASNNSKTRREIPGRNPATHAIGIAE